MNPYQPADLTPLIVARSSIDNQKCPITSAILLKASLILNERIKQSKENLDTRVGRDEVITNGLLAYIPISWSIQTVIEEIFHENRTVFEKFRIIISDEISFNSTIDSLITDLVQITYVGCNSENLINEKIAGISIDANQISGSLIRDYFKGIEESKLQASRSLSNQVLVKMQQALVANNSELHEKSMKYINLIRSSISEMIAITPNKEILKENFELLGLIQCSLRQS